MPPTPKLPDAPDTGNPPLTLEQLTAEVIADLDRTKQQMKEIRMLIDQSRGEVEKLKQRQASESMRLKQIQSAFDSAPREDIRRAYDTVLDVQQRLFSMSGQIERMQAQQGTLEQYSAMLEKISEALQMNQSSGSVAGTSAPKSMVVRVVEAQEAERLRLSRLMHDGPAQVLSNFILQVEIAVRLFEMDPVRAKEELTTLKTSASSAFQRIRNFIFDLRPMMLDDLGLIPTIRRYLDAYKDQGQTEINFIFTGAERRISSHLEIILFRSVQQLVGLARDPCQASKIKVSMDLDDLKTRVTVEHDGKIMEEKSETGEDTHGLNALRERIEMLGGSFEYSAQAGQGTRIFLELPVAE